MEVKKRFSTICIIVLCIFGVLFFVNQGPRRIRLMTPSEKTIKKDVTRYLEKRYDEKFHITNIISPSFEYACYKITAYPYGTQMDMEHKITVQGWEDNGLITYYDNYAVVKLIPEIKEYICNIVKEEFSKNKVYVTFYKEWYENNLNANITLKELLEKNEGNWINSMNLQVDVYSKDIEKNTYKNKVKTIVRHLAEKNIIGSSRFYLIYDENKFNQLPEFLNKNINQGKCGKDFIYLDILTNNEKEIYYEYLEEKERGIE